MEFPISKTLRLDVGKPMVRALRRADANAVSIGMVIIGAYDKSNSMVKSGVGIDIIG